MKSVYALVNSPQELMKSSSGGAFIAFCNAIELKYGSGNVSFYGACFNKKMEVVHARVTSAGDCSLFQGSKYVKSNIGDCYKLVEQDLIDGKIVLFSGTPCQVSAIKKYINNKNIELNKLYTIDIICHGTPKESIWDDYKVFLEKKAQSKLIAYSFRYKPEGWKAYPAFAKFENGKKFINTANTSVFSKLHIRGYSINETCFLCKFACMDRQGDITLGDYWGIEEINPDIMNQKGVSLVILNTSKAENLIDILIKNNEIKIEKTEGESFIKYQQNLKKPTTKPVDYELFWADYKEKGFEYILKKYINFNIKYRTLYTIKKIIRKTIVIDYYRRFKQRRKVKKT